MSRKTNPDPTVAKWQAYVETWLAVGGNEMALRNIAAHLGLLTQEVIRLKRQLQLSKKRNARKPPPLATARDHQHRNRENLNEP